MYVAHCPEAPIIDAGLTVDPSGAYFRREGLSGHYICGASPLSEVMTYIVVDNKLFLCQVIPVPTFSLADLFDVS